MSQKLNKYKHHDHVCICFLKKKKYGIFSCQKVVEYILAKVFNRLYKWSSLTVNIPNLTATSILEYTVIFNGLFFQRCRRGGLTLLKEGNERKEVWKFLFLLIFKLKLRLSLVLFLAKLRKPTYGVITLLFKANIYQILCDFNSINNLSTVIFFLPLVTTGIQVYISQTFQSMHPRNSIELDQWGIFNTAKSQTKLKIITRLIFG